MLGLTHTTSPLAEDPVTPKEAVTKPKSAEEAERYLFVSQHYTQLIYVKVATDYKLSVAQDPVTPEEDVTKPSRGQQEKLQGTSFSASTTLNLETAMSLYKLTESQSFWEVQQDTRCLMGWGSNTVVVAFRGTASMKNALADVQVCDELMVIKLFDLVVYLSNSALHSLC